MFYLLDNTPSPSGDLHGIPWMHVALAVLECLLQIVPEVYRVRIIGKRF
jgi:hypothetical protein